MWAHGVGNGGAQGLGAVGARPQHRSPMAMSAGGVGDSPMAAVMRQRRSAAAPMPPGRAGRVGPGAPIGEWMGGAGPFRVK
jgi:hypothetical protein